MTEPKLCEEKHKRVDERLNDLEGTVETLVKNDAVNTTLISQLCKKLDGLTAAVWGLVLTLVVALLGFFFYSVQTGIFQNLGGK
jgi:tetrahydromethanopterin S-methyltransferase subunit G